MILTGMIVDSIVLGRIATKWGKTEIGGGLFRSEWSNLVGRWCVHFYNRFSKAPGPAIETAFTRWAERTDDKATRQMVERFLHGLSNEYKRLRRESNSDFVIDAAARFFNRVRLEKLSRNIEANLENGDVERALKETVGFSQMEMGMGSTVKVFTDQDAVKRAFERNEDALIRYPGELGKFFGNELCRDAFVAFMGPEKRGKSYWLWDIAWRGALQRRKVAYFVVGDMSEEQVMLRMLTRAAKRPLDGKSIQYPIGIRRLDQAKAQVKTERRSYDGPLTWQAGWRALQKTLRMKIRSKESYIRLSVHSADSLSVAGMDEILDEWAREGWVADVVVIDYADNLEMDGRDDVRHKINATWKALRGLSQDRHCLVVTATQADAASYDAQLISRKNFSEDKRKFAHITGMLGINQTPEEKEHGIYRLNWLARRQSYYSERACVFTASCLAVANPAVRACA